MSSRVKLFKRVFWGVVIVAMLALTAVLLSAIPAIAVLQLSPLIIGILFGIIIGNSLGNFIPATLIPGIRFSSRKILRLAIILYGFRITFQQIAEVGAAGLMMDIVMLSTTFLLGAFLGIRFMKLDPKLAFLTASGASICGAAAVLATEPVVKAEPHKTAMAVATVVIFGTISMFLYPVLYRAGLFDLDFSWFGIYIGATVHEVAHVVAAGDAISVETSDTAVIVKMTRVMLLVPLLLLLSIYISKKYPEQNPDGKKVPIMIPWFAVGFIAVAAFNSLQLLPLPLVNGINIFDTFLLTMAMTALGLETNINKMKIAGFKPFILAFLLFLWLLAGGYFLTLFFRDLTSA